MAAEAGCGSTQTKSTLDDTRAHDLGKLPHVRATVDYTIEIPMAQMGADFTMTQPYF